MKREFDMKNYKPDYEHIRCKCGGVIGMYNRNTFNCESCNKEFQMHELDFDRCSVNIKTGWIFPVKNVETKGKNQNEILKRR